MTWPNRIMTYATSVCDILLKYWTNFQYRRYNKFRFSAASQYYDDISYQYTCAKLGRDASRELKLTKLCPHFIKKSSIMPPSNLPIGNPITRPLIKINQNNVKQHTTPNLIFKFHLTLFALTHPISQYLIRIPSNWSNNGFYKTVVLNQWSMNYANWY